MTPEEAREILGRFLAEKVTTSQLQAEEAYIWLQFQQAIQKGPHAKRLAELHTALVDAEHGGQPAAAGAKEEEAAILAELELEIRLKLAMEGLPEEWRPR